MWLFVMMWCLSPTLYLSKRVKQCGSLESLKGIIQVTTYEASYDIFIDMIDLSCYENKIL